MCGLRRAEIAGLHAGDIQGGSLRIRGKGGRERLVPMPPIVSDALAGFRDTDAYVFAQRGSFGHKPMTPHYVGKLISRQLGEGVTAHMLRHRFASVAYGAERDIRAVQNSSDTRRSRRHRSTPPCPPVRPQRP